MRKPYIPKTSYKSPAKNSRKKVISLFINFLKLLLFVIIVFGIAYILYSPILNIRSFNLNLEDGGVKQDILAKAESSVQDNSHWWYNNKNIFLLRSDKLEQYLLQEFPNIKNIEIKRSILSQTINLNINFRTAIFRICENESCYNISEEGVNMGLNTSGSESLVIIKGASPRSAGENVFSNREISWLKNILEEYNKIDSVKISSMDIQQRSQESIISLFVYTDQGYYIILDLDTDIIYQAQVLKQVFISQLPLEKRSILEYIDLRIKDRVYYKFK